MRAAKTAQKWAGQPMVFQNPGYEKERRRLNGVKIRISARAALASIPYGIVPKDLAYI